MKYGTNGLANTAIDFASIASEPVVCICGNAQNSVANDPKARSRSKKLKKTVALYLTMVFVSTCAIFWLEHSTILNAFRTALVAAIGKTFAASWVTSLFD